MQRTGESLLDTTYVVGIYNLNKEGIDILSTFDDLNRETKEPSEICTFVCMILGETGFFSWFLGYLQFQNSQLTVLLLGQSLKGLYLLI